MACKQLTKEEYDILILQNPGATGHSDPDCGGKCCGDLLCDWNEFDIGGIANENSYTIDVPGGRLRFYSPPSYQLIKNSTYYDDKWILPKPNSYAIVTNYMELQYTPSGGTFYTTRLVHRRAVVLACQDGEIVDITNTHLQWSNPGLTDSCGNPTGPENDRRGLYRRKSSDVPFCDSGFWDQHTFEAYQPDGANIYFNC